MTLYKREIRPLTLYYIKTDPNYVTNFVSAKVKKKILKQNILKGNLTKNQKT